MKQLLKISIAALSTTIIMSCNSTTSTTNNADVSTTSNKVEANVTTSKMPLEDLKKAINDFDETLDKLDDAISSSLKKSKLDTICPQLLEVKKGNLLKKEKDESIKEIDSYVEYFDNSYAYSDALSSRNYCFNTFDVNYLGKKISSAMSKDQVKSILGKVAYENNEVLIYAGLDHITEAVTGEKSYYPVLQLLFKDGKLIALASSYRHSTM